jgi:hypothetical protein
MRVVVVGARRARQGTGPFLAAALLEAGADVCAIVGTSDASVAAAKAELQQRLRIDCRGYTGLREALAAEQPCAVALCSPWRYHGEQLAQIAAAGCHCLVEKPLAWPANMAAVDALIERFEVRGRVLQMVTQWPLTLPAFQQLHPYPAENVSRFAMGLGPISIGPDMITDAAPHFISMLQALVGPGSFNRVEVEAGPGVDHLTLECSYRHATGSCHSTLSLVTCPEPPRPAWYAINGRRVDREIALPEYRQFLAVNEHRVALQDPLLEVADRFMVALQSGHGDGDSLRNAHQNLLQLASALPESLTAQPVEKSSDGTPGL